MSIPGSANLLLAGGGAAYQIDQSLRFNSADSAYLNRTPGSSGSTTTWTISTWVKRASLGAAQMIWSAGTSGITTLSFQSDDTLRLRNSTVEYITNWRFRDPSAWYHIVVKWDTTNGTQADRAIIYVNGVALGTGDYSTYDKATSSEASTWNTNVAHNLGRYAFNGTSYLGGYLAEINFIDGSALTPSSFGETDLITGAWIPKKYSGSYGTNGFYLTFADNSNTTAATLGKDYSGNGNNWTPNSFSVTAGTGNDVLSDTPTTNWATILSTNPTYGYETTTFTDGNLQTTFYPRGDIGNPSAPALSSITIPASGKWYYEFTTAGSNNYTFGIAANNSGNLYNFTLSRAFWGWYHLYQAGYPSNGNGNSIYGGASGSASGGGFINVGDIIGVEIDIPNGSIVFKKNGSSYASITSCNFSSYTEFVIQWGTATNGISGSSIIANFGQRSFSYTQPTGYKALNTANLPEPTIKNSGKYFNTVLWTGNGSTQTISGVGFESDFIWTKKRNGTQDYFLYDQVRGLTNGNYKELRSNSTAVEGVPGTANSGLTSITSDGFTLGSDASVNANTGTYVGWCWDAGGTGSSNTAGSITSTVSANASAGFSIVTYTSPNNSADQTVGHSLGVKPSLIIIKNRDLTYNWDIYHSSLGYNASLIFTTAGTRSGAFGAEPTSTVFTTKTGYTHNSTNKYVAYCFSEVAGYSKFGNYVGNSSSDGPFVYLGFRPRFIWIKAATSVLSGYDSWRGWYTVDTERYPYNSSDENQLWVNSYADEDKRGNGSDAGNLGIDILSNGFKIRRDSSYAVEINYTGATMIYCAWAEHPFKYANAR